MNAFVKKCLFAFPPETAHRLALSSLQVAYLTKLAKFFPKLAAQPTTLMGLTFPNRLGLAAGFDKNADYVDALATLGFGFIEVGTITPKPQIGNPRPRLFRLSHSRAIINRMGFNNKGADYVAARLARIQYRGILGINIGKNKDTPNESALEDYLMCFHKLARFASYMTINISSPNTAGLRDLHQTALLTTLLATLKQAQQELHRTTQKYVPLVVKISPDLSLEELTQMAEVLLTQKIDGVIATNTTLAREHLTDNTHAAQAGGLSGAPLCARNTLVISQLKTLLQNHIPIIASGGIMDTTSLQAKFQAGAQLAQIYSGLIYRGPTLLRELALTLAS